MPYVKLAAATLAVLFPFLANALDNMDGGSISGVITPTGLGIDIGVDAVNVDTHDVSKAITVNHETGEYRISSLTPGLYNLRIAVPGFAILGVHTGVANQALQIDDDSVIRTLIVNLAEAMSEKSIASALVAYSEQYEDSRGHTLKEKETELYSVAATFQEQTYSLEISLLEGNEMQAVAICHGTLKLLIPEEELDPGVSSDRCWDEIKWLAKDYGVWRIIQEEQIGAWMIDGPEGTYYYNSHASPADWYSYPPFKFTSKQTLSNVEVLAGIDSPGHDYTIPKDIADIGVRFARERDESRANLSRSILERLLRALQQLSSDTGVYPSTEEGLMALLTARPGIDGWQGPYAKAWTRRSRDYMPRPDDTTTLGFYDIYNRAIIYENHFSPDDTAYSFIAALGKNGLFESDPVVGKVEGDDIVIWLETEDSGNQ